ncbi:LamG domain-containing protein, partial [Patescibacteria group bacterium]|nr:LamG domain-containing protein [Patescibacteria group bacterium]
GIIDEVRIYNRVLSATEISDLYQAGARRMKPNTSLKEYQTGGLVGNWTFNGPDMDWGSTTAEALDRSGNSNNGDVVNGAKAMDGISGQALEFDGTDDYVARTDSDLSSGFPGKSGGSDSSFSVSFWAKPNTMADYDMFLSKQDDSDRGWAVFTSANKNIYFQMGTGAETYVNAYTANNVLSSDVWYHIVAAFDTSADTMTIYLDGSISSNGANNPKSNSDTLRGTSKDLRIGSYGGAGGTFFDGLIDEVRVYNHALSTNEITDLYNAGARRLKTN